MASQRKKNGSILSKKGFSEWRPFSARAKNSSNCFLSLTAILQVRQTGTQFYPLTISSVIRATFSAWGNFRDRATPRYWESALREAIGPAIGHVGGRRRLPLVSKGGNRVKRSQQEFPLRPGLYVPARTLAMVRSSDALRCRKRVAANRPLIRQRHPNPSCGGPRALTAEPRTRRGQSRTA
jgi:hypothetical protein